MLKIGLIIFALMVINANLIQTFLDRKTMYKKCDIYDQPAILYLFVFLGIFTLPFMKQIKRLRRRLYLENKLKELRRTVELKCDGIPGRSEQKLANLERQLKLERIKRKS
jgi:hypothetical protein